MTGYPRRKRTRLSDESYAEPNAICSVTIAVKGRQTVFANPEIATGTVAVLRSLAAARGVRIYAFCIMPDHVHLIMSPSTDCSVIAFVGQLKNLILRMSWNYGVSGSFWQKGFWDHFLRADEDLHVAVEYVLANPVLAGLVEDADLYPYSGGFDLVP
jgi:REP element-mobilizing transposase RayT